MRQAVSSGSQLGSLNCCGRYWNTGATRSVSALGSGTCRPATQNWLGPTALASVSPHVAFVTTAPSANLLMLNRNIMSLLWGQELQGVYGTTLLLRNCEAVNSRGPALKTRDGSKGLS